jgi:hypothetical protein
VSSTAADAGSATAKSPGGRGCRHLKIKESFHVITTFKKKYRSRPYSNGKRTLTNIYFLTIDNYLKHLLLGDREARGQSSNHRNV